MKQSLHALSRQPILGGRTLNQLHQSYICRENQVMHENVSKRAKLTAITETSGL